MSIEYKNVASVFNEDVKYFYKILLNINVIERQDGNLIYDLTGAYRIMQKISLILDKCNIQHISYFENFLELSKENNIKMYRIFEYIIKIKQVQKFKNIKHLYKKNKSLDYYLNKKNVKQC